MKVISVVSTLLCLHLPAAMAGNIRSYELPEFVSVGQLFTTDEGDLVVTYTSRRNADHFWNADKREDLPDADPEKISHDKAAFDEVIARNKLVRLEFKSRGQMTLTSGTVISGEWLDTPSRCQWFYHAYVKARPTSGEEKALAFLIRRPPQPQSLVYNCAGVSGGSFLSVGLADSSPLLYRRPGGGFYVVVVGLPYVIGFNDDGDTDFRSEKKPLVILSEEIVAAAYEAMANGKITPQAAVDSVQAAASSSSQK
jgi:hypothetical protein